MTTSDTQVSNLIINRLTKAQYEAIQSPSPNEIYIITDEVIASSDIVNALGYTPYNGTTNPNGYTSNTGTVTSVNNVQPVDGNVTLSIPSEVTENTVSGWGFTKNTGTITGITMNGTSKGTSGVVDLGTVITDISGKQDTLVSGTNIKTINNISILGSGNIDVTGGGGGSTTWGNIGGTLADQTDLKNALDAKLDSSAIEAYTASEVETLWGSV